MDAAAFVTEDEEAVSSHHDASYALFIQKAETPVVKESLLASSF
jgi:hypothetical protein